MLNNLKTLIQDKLNDSIKNKFNVDLVINTEEPKDKTKGDIAVPTFALAKALRRNPMELTETIKEMLESVDLFSEINIIGPYVNCFYSKTKLSKMIIDELNKQKENKKLGTICIDYSSPNIAKNFSIGHLRSTIIGESLGNIFEYSGYDVIRINHLGDFGTQFGKLIYAYLNWGNGEDYKTITLDKLVELYVRFHKEAELNPSLDDEARKIFNELENGNEYYNELWNNFKNSSLKEFNRVYELLGVHFTEYSSEANASHNAKHVLDLLESKGVLEIDDGATIVRMSDEAMPPAIVRRSDGATLYITRDLEEIHRRYDKYHFDKMLYCVGNEQKLYFKQLQEVLRKIDAPFKESVTHVNFGLVLTDGKKMSTRTGNAVKLVDVLNEAIKMSKAHIEEKNSSLENKDEIAKAIGVSSVIFNDLKNYRENNYEFSLEDATKFEGLTGPYVEYTSVRIGSILNDNNFNSNIDYNLFNNPICFDILKELDYFDDIINKCRMEFAPNYLAKYLLNLSSLFNNFYAKEKVLVDDLNERNSKLYFLSLIKNKLDLGMKLLGMRLVNKM